MAKIAIVGSRYYRKSVESVIERWKPLRDFISGLPDDAIVVSGGAPGVDAMAEHFAKKRGLETIIFPAEWHKYGNSAGMIRNAEIVRTADEIVAFWDGTSNGTRNTLERARKAGKPVTIFNAEGIAHEQG